MWPKLCDIKLWNCQLVDVVSEVVHGPAITIKLDIKDGDKTIPVSVDFSPLIEAKAPFLSQLIYWPRFDKRWPSRRKIDTLKKIGVDFVAKKNFHWYYSYVECEKELGRDIDNELNGEEGCRKKVHRIMKCLLETVWSDNKPETCALSSYMLKVVMKLISIYQICSTIFHLFFPITPSIPSMTQFKSWQQGWTPEKLEHYNWGYFAASVVRECVCVWERERERERETSSKRVGLWHSSAKPLGTGSGSDRVCLHVRHHNSRVVWRHNSLHNEYGGERHK